MEPILEGGGKPRNWCRPLTPMCPYIKSAIKQVVTFDMEALFSSDHLLVAVPGRRLGIGGGPRAAGFIDVNASSAADIVRLAPTTSAQAAEFIVGERTKNGGYNDPIDFAQRICPRVSVDFNNALIRIGNAQIVARGTDPGKLGFKCAPAKRGEDPTLELYGVRHHYVGHVTLLR